MIREWKRLPSPFLIPTGLHRPVLRAVEAVCWAQRPLCAHGTYLQRTGPPSFHVAVLGSDGSLMVCLQLTRQSLILTEQSANSRNWKNKTSLPVTLLVLKDSAAGSANEKRYYFQKPFSPKQQLYVTQFPRD